MSLELANRLFPDVTETWDEVVAKYPRRPEGQKVSRVAPSPTGFMHIGTVYTGMVSEKFVHQDSQDGVFFLRIEDTDQEREVEGAKDLIVRGLQKFGIEINEGPIGEGLAEVGGYGPYTQSLRKELYRVLAKQRVAEGKAYPCWLTSEEIDAMRAEQQREKKLMGIYGEYAKWRDASFAEQEKMIASGEPFVIRFRGHSDGSKKVIVKDVIRGEVEMQDSYQDTVLIKAKDELPTYHFAHLVDDYLMGTTHVIRSDERFASLPLHQKLFETLNVPVPHYAHVSPLMKSVDGKKRKLSKRHDPEADVQWFFAEGYDVEAIKEFLMNIVDPSFEQWQKENLDKTYKDFSFDLSKMNQSGALLDQVKLSFTSKEWIARLDKATFVEKCLERAHRYNPELHALMLKHQTYTFDALNIERCIEADPKRFSKFSDISTQLPNFYDEVYEANYETKPAFPENITQAVINRFVNIYLQKIDLDLTKEAWFEQLKEIGQDLGEGMNFATTNKEFKEGGYIGKIGDLAMFLRIQLLLSSSTPDLCETMKVMGKERVEKRLQRAVK